MILKSQIENLVSELKLELRSIFIYIYRKILFLPGKKTFMFKMFYLE